MRTFEAAVQPLLAVFLPPVTFRHTSCGREAPQFFNCNLAEGGVINFVAEII